MALEKKAPEQREVSQKELHITGAMQIPVSDGRVRLHADGASGAYVVTLPPVAMAQGRDYFVVCRNADLVNTVTVTDDNDSECWAGDIVFNGKCDRAIFRSDGQCWFVCCQNVTFTGTSAPPTTPSP